MLAAGALAFGGCVYSIQRAGDAIGAALDGFLDFDLGDDGLMIGWDENDETPPTTLPPQPDATCSALTRVALLTEASGQVWRDHGIGADSPTVRHDLSVVLPELRDGLWDAVAASPPAVADPLAVALGHVVDGIAQLGAGTTPVEVALVALEGGSAIDEASDALGSGCGDLDLIGPFASYLTVETAPTTSTTTLASS